ncbi:unnamed protein product [Aphanomyces euteiches]
MLWRRRFSTSIANPALCFIHPSAKVDPSATLSPYCVVQANAIIHENCKIGAGTVVGENVVLGSDSDIGSQVTLEHCVVGKRTVVHTGTRIGQDGFGFVLDASGNHAKKPQTLLVEIQDDVEIGSVSLFVGVRTDSCQGTKMDNLIQIGHNVHLGRNCIIAAQTGIAGSTTVGANVHIGGQVGIAQHLTIGDNVRIAAKSGVMHHLAANSTFGTFHFP